ncbi:MAG: hypothetical protein ACRC68_06790, partial [Clostridium sp.]
NIKAAKKKGISIGRYQSYLELDDDLLEDAIENMSIDELNKLLSGSNNSIRLNEEAVDEILDEIEDRIEENNEQDSDNDDLDDHDTNDDNNSNDSDDYID